jgi:hypothetical protein
MSTEMYRDIVKEANKGIEALGKEVVQLRAENKELRRLIGLGITYEEPLILTKDMEVTDGSK